MSDLSKVLQKAKGFETNKEIALAKEFISLNDLLSNVIKAIQAQTAPLTASELRSEPIQVNTDLSPLKDAINEIIPAIQSIPTLDLSGVTKLLEKIGNKEEKEVDLKELENISSILKTLNDSINAIHIPEPIKGEETIPDLKEIQKILNVLNENLIAIEIPEFDYEKLEKIIRKIKISGGGGPSTVTTTPASGSTQDVNITKVGGNAVTTTVPVSGTFFQATQPVSIAGTVATAPTIPTTASHNQLDIGTTEVAVPTVAGSDTTCIKAMAANAQKVYLGKTGVTSTNGFELSAGDSIEVDTTDAVPWFLVAGSGTQRICYIIVS